MKPVRVIVEVDAADHVTTGVVVEALRAMLPKRAVFHKCEPGSPYEVGSVKWGRARVFPMHVPAADKGLEIAQ